MLMNKSVVLINKNEMTLLPKKNLRQIRGRFCCESTVDRWVVDVEFLTPLLGHPISKVLCYVIGWRIQPGPKHLHQLGSCFKTRK